MNLRILRPKRSHPPDERERRVEEQIEVEKRQERLVERQAMLRAELEVIRRSGGRTI